MTYQDGYNDGHEDRIFQHKPSVPDWASGAYRQGYWDAYHGRDV